MFFKRSPMTPSVPSPATQSAARATGKRHRRQALMLSAAIAAAAPTVAFLLTHGSGRARAADAVDGTSVPISTDVNGNVQLAQLSEPVDDAGKLAKGIAQYNAHQYEEAVATLQTVNANQLSAQQKQALSDTMRQSQQRQRSAQGCPS